jgi:hypothetical protein
MIVGGVSRTPAPLGSIRDAEPLPPLVKLDAPPRLHRRSLRRGVGVLQAVSQRGVALVLESHD